MIYLPLFIGICSTKAVLEGLTLWSTNLTLWSTTFNLMIYHVKGSLWSTKSCPEPPPQKKKQVDHKMRVLRVDPYDLPTFFGGLCFCLFFCFYLNQKNKEGFGKGFSLLFFSVHLFLWNILLPKVPKTLKNILFLLCLCLAGSFSFSSKSSTIQKTQKLNKKNKSNQNIT